MVSRAPVSQHFTDHTVGVNYIWLLWFLLLAHQHYHFADRVYDSTEPVELTAKLASIIQDRLGERCVLLGTSGL